MIIHRSRKTDEKSLENVGLAKTTDFPDGTSMLCENLGGGMAIVKHLDTVIHPQEDDMAEFLKGV